MGVCVCIYVSYQCIVYFILFGFIFVRFLWFSLVFMLFLVMFSAAFCELQQFQVNPDPPLHFTSQELASPRVTMCRGLTQM